ncbi:MULTISPECIES: bifunctional glycosyl transferase/transpeptidase [Providencia]|uniref:bifunctional glycosyl transferase/transpeptidase n=1 Tax=Providencia TaxID=586 RepID=UPI00197D0058|nr:MULTISPECIES: bifunctional glycosyl transferase/transpeptidase [Providencia]HEC8330168.1 bifunctional glycosyl transferase/transpeptidase [Providencia rettgeri]MBN4864217.1 bifunctional glycosyl transferase/transpeptidase [Providencia stuartii]MBN4873539.1 bifunctional glycosyl transferase/transpeptidase [Providencia stuartii]MBN4877340.1 bifunctional glycosyl transferase/transpeptidase [Providencia stuartii]MBN4882740.1 bifunctional glycosyl transferase/transpeptidase [Providencia stuartii
MSGKDFEPIGRRNKKTADKKQSSSRRRRDRDDYDDEDLYQDDDIEEQYLDDEDEEEHMAKKGSKNKKQRKVKSKWRWFWLLVKLMIVFAVLLAAYGFYLNQQIKERLDGKVWDLPAAVYGRMVNLEPGMDYSQAEMTRLLEGMQYRKVSKITTSGEFVVRGNTIEILRRPFNFPDQKEGQILARMVFENNALSKIENMENGRSFGFFRLDPKLITMMQSANNEQRLVLPLADFPESLVKILLETEDRNFYEHDGVSLYSIGRAVVANLTAGRSVQGGSTLTQQLVKNLFLTNERTLKRKANEAYMALLLDYNYSKERILELYLNEVFLGQNGNDEIRGFPLASLYYFGRPINELSFDQQALLVGMVQGASTYNPWTKPQNAIKRRNIVLKILETRGVIDQEMYQVLSARPLGVKNKEGLVASQPAFMQMVRLELNEKLGDKVKELSGAKIFTTLDPVAQTAAENAVENGVADLRKTRKLDDIEGAMVVVDRINGEVRAMVGGSQPQFSGFNRALNARRSIGSLAKPPVYLAALSEPDRYRLNTWLKDEPLTVKVGNQNWSPRNYSRNFNGRMMLVDALAKSQNIPTVNLGLDIGLDQVFNTFVRLGAPAAAMEKVPAMFLGAVNLTPAEVAQVYQTIGGEGNRAKLSSLRSVIDGDGNEIYQSYPSAERAVPSQAAYLTLYGMQQVVNQGTGRVLLSKYGKYNLAGKTGTTNDLRDSWYAGIDGKEVAIVWVGRDNNGPTQLTGATGALKVYQRYLDNQAPLALINRAPEGIVDMQVTADGQLSCSNFGGGRMLPIWTDNPDSLCQASEDQAPTWNLNGNNDEQKSDAPDWVKDMFGDNP